ncbi:HD-GYP domain-containing protein [Actinospica sp.]|uniref:HD-GYP domain-containing protein n=1 Tax=Actinospica sp. TaxID=1872142 RepID=UPI002C4D1F17|nr:HD domain-containing phosphohydrolase [Actinospica sp.]HWG25924.1 HD domain-containing phosphohydrolase [Actinospica sp.]
MPQRARYFFTAVIAAAAVAAACVLPGTDWANVPRAPFLVLLLLQVLLNLTIRLPDTQESPAGPAMVSVLLASIVLLPPGAAALTGAVSSSCMVLRRARPTRVGFACAVAFLAAAAAGEVYHAADGRTVLTGSDFPGALVPIGLAVLVLSVVPAAVIETFLVQVGRQTQRAALRDFTLRMVPRNIAYALVGLLTAVLWTVSYDALAAIVLLGPVIVTRWATVQYEEQRTAHDAIIRTLVQAVEIKDLYTRGHSERVARISEMIADELRLPPERVEVLRYAATLHDVGKLGVPTRLLRKTERLDDEEFEEIRLHPSRGVEVVRDIAFLDEAYSAILHHHERMDGLGYPSGLRGMRIPPFARIIAVADAFDSMTSTRSYRGARGSDEALNELRANMGTQFDPAIVDAIAAALSRAELAGRPWRGDGTACPGARGGQPELAELPPGAVVAQFDHDDPAYQLLAVDVEGAEKPQTDDYASGSEPPTDESAEREPAVDETSGGDNPVPDVSLPAATLPDAALPDAVLPDPVLPDAVLPDPKQPPAPRDELRLAPFRPELNLPTQTKREPKNDRAADRAADLATERGTDRDTPTNTGPETEGR